MNLKPIQIVAIGAGVVFGLPIIIGLIIGHFSSPRVGIGIGILILAVVLFLGHRQFTKKARQQGKDDNA